MRLLLVLLLVCSSRIQGTARETASAEPPHQTVGEKATKGMQSGPFEPTEQYVTTYSGDKIYVHVRDWKGKDNVLLPAITDRIVGKALLQGSGTPVRIDQYPWGLLVVVPLEQHVKDGETTVVLEVPGDISELSHPRIVSGSSSHFMLLQGDTAKLEGGLHYNPGPDWIDHWINLTDSITWKVKVPSAMTTSVEMTYSCAPGCAGAQFEITTNKSKLTGRSRETTGMWKDWQNFERRSVPGTLHLDAGENLITLRAIKKGSTEEILRLYGVYLFSAKAKQVFAAESQRALKTRVDASWLKQAKYGVMVHWLPNSMPRSGPKKDFCQAVYDFDVQRFANMAKDAGAGYVIFTLAQRQFFAAPYQSVEKILPGRTCNDRDLPEDLADALGAKGIKLILYYHHGVGDTEWAKSSGFLQNDKSEFFVHEAAILTEIGSRYGAKLAGWWFDDRYPLQPFEALDQAAKAGNPNRIVAFNSWILPKSTDFHDYWAGEVGGELTKLPETGFFSDGGIAGGLEPHVLIFLDDPWVHGAADKPIRPPLFTDEQLVDYVMDCNRKGAAVTMNIGVYQDGTASPETVKLLEAVRKKVRGS